MSPRIQRISDEIHMQRAPQYLFPTRIAMAVKKALALPVFVVVRFPVPGGHFQYTMMRYE